MMDKAMASKMMGMMRVEGMTNKIAGAMMRLGQQMMRGGNGAAKKVAKAMGRGKK